jgi:hypothetical protein
MWKALLFLLLSSAVAFQANAQGADCQLKNPVITIHFGSGNVSEANTGVPVSYERISGSCPRDGYYSYTAYTADCFRGDWLTLVEDHTPGDVSGNMMLVNASYYTGAFFSSTIKGLKGGTTYEFAAWLMNVCRISEKCPFPLLPNITIQLRTLAGKAIAQFNTGDLGRRHEPQWTRYPAFFTMPPSETALTLVMLNNNPGGCGNDFALDDITFRECVKRPPIVTAAPKKITPVKKKPVAFRVSKKASPTVANNKPTIVQTVVREKDSRTYASPALQLRSAVLPPPPPLLATRTNSLVKQIETEAGEINISLYDNGEIDGDTVSIYHNNVLLIAHARLSQKPVSMRIAVDAAHPRHELVMVAENMGSIPPNTSMMIITAGNRRYEVFISSTEQRNAKVIFNLQK